MRRDNWRRHRRLVFGYVGFFVVLVGLFGGARLHAYSASERNDEDAIDVDVDAAEDLFGLGDVHSIQLSYDADDYRRAIDTYLATGAKDFFPADALIDGVRVPQVGLRLKGTSSLRDLATQSATPEQLPWLLSFDEYVRNRTFDGHQAIAFRTAGGATPTTVANEALAMLLIDRAGAPGSQASWSTLRMNDGAAALRLVLETHDATFAKDDFAHKGVLYKALAGGAFLYRGEDPLAYTDSFRQLTRRNKQDLEPLIGLLRWAQRSSDEEFAAQAAGRLDLDSFAEYFALHNLLLDEDDMAGPGQNYTLFYDLETERFHVITWDMNQAFTGDVARAEDDHGLVVTNLLKARLLAVPSFVERYDAAWARLSARLYTDGDAATAVEDLAATLAKVPESVLPRTTVDAELDALREVVRRRTAALAKLAAGSGR